MKSFLAIIAPVVPTALVATSLSVAFAGSQECSGVVAVPIRSSVNLRVMVVKGSTWDSEEGMRALRDGFAVAERITGRKIQREWHAVDRPEALEKIVYNQYAESAGLELIDSLGDPNLPTLIFTGRFISSGEYWIDELKAAVNKNQFGKVGRAFLFSPIGKSNSRLPKYEGIVISHRIEGKVGRIIAHELGHLLSNRGHSLDPRNLMFPFTASMGLGCLWTEPWKSLSDKSRYVMEYPAENEID